MKRHVLITGGAGFIGSHLADDLLAQGYRVRVLDNLSEQVHGDLATVGGRPPYLADDAELMVGDVRDPAAVERAVAGVDAVFHLAAVVGVGQSMYEVAHYTSTNNLGTAVLAEALIRRQQAGRPVERWVVASSMSVYGEGLYRDPQGRPVHDARRSRPQLEAHRWEPTGPGGERLEPVATGEEKTPDLASIYALSKFDQERMSLLLGSAYGIPTVALRFFNAYGTRQALSNPYTGVLAIFAARLLNDKPPLIFEDGHQRRDFVHVSDVARACRLALEAPDAPGHAFNVGSGRSYTVHEVAAALAAVLGREDIEPEVTGRYRVGDIRHCFADISLARRTLGFEPRMALEDGLAELAGWLEGQVAQDRVGKMSTELAERGLTV
jgi:dTDP-L-rhamnose 4-epimerase